MVAKKMKTLESHYPMIQLNYAQYMEAIWRQ